MAKQHPTHPLVYQCPLCKDLVSLTHFSTSTSGLSIQCERCDGEIFVASPGTSGAAKSPRTTAKKPKAAAPAAPTEDDEPAPAAEVEASTDSSRAKRKPRAPSTNPKERCPKCGLPRPSDADNCARCGLGFANIGVTFDPDRFSKPQNAIEREALRLWAELWEHWDEREQHERFVQYCNAQNLLELAAHHYREVKDDGGEEAAMAADYLAKILDLVQTKFVSEQARGDSKATVQRGKWLMMGVLLVFALIAFYIIWGKMSGTTAMQMQMP